MWEKCTHIFYRGGLVVRSRLCVRRILRSKRYSIGDPPWDLLHAKSYVKAKRPPTGVVRKFGEEESAQVSSTVYDRGSELRGLPQNCPRVSSKRDLNTAET
ncbi:hypothetical protein AVEN_79269-1 [Araneus ventricosus]|uniref:Uncharacterized protein n=1 Tax=Araneus ventricosus TaxID=182803 RepID=A0A4Y2VCJ6_ARAVE|nr:hypothetical protein AVEN_79269-1 [Araneus ventricosus]